MENNSTVVNVQVDNIPSKAPYTSKLYVENKLSLFQGPFRSRKTEKIDVRRRKNGKTRGFES